MGFSQVQYEDAIWLQKLVYYTALQLDGVTAITDVLKEGYALFKDLVNVTITIVGSSSKNIRGVAATKCEDGAAGDNRYYLSGIVTNVKPGFKGPGHVWVITRGDAVRTYVGVNTTVDPPVYLCGITAQWYLGAEAGSVATAAANMQGIGRVVAKPLITDATLTATPAYILCDIGQFAGA